MFAARSSVKNIADENNSCRYSCAIYWTQTDGCELKTINIKLCSYLRQYVHNSSALNCRYCRGGIGSSSPSLCRSRPWGEYRTNNTDTYHTFAYSRNPLATDGFDFCNFLAISSFAPTFWTVGPIRMAIAQAPPMVVPLDVGLHAPRTLTCSNVCLLSTSRWPLAMVRLAHEMSAKLLTIPANACSWRQHCYRSCCCLRVVDAMYCIIIYTHIDGHDHADPYGSGVWETQKRRSVAGQSVASWNTPRRNKAVNTLIWPTGRPCTRSVKTYQSAVYHCMFLYI